MSGDLWAMARNGTTLLPSEVKKLAADYDRLRERLARREEQLRHAMEMVNRRERVFQAMREPSAAVIIAMQSADLHGDVTDEQCVAMTRAAVAAAEREA